MCCRPPTHKAEKGGAQPEPLPDAEWTPASGTQPSKGARAEPNEEEGAAGEPPDFAPGTNARRRTALKKPPTRPSRLLSALSFRSTPATTAPSVGSATSSRKSYRG